MCCVYGRKAKDWRPPKSNHFELPLSPRLSTDRKIPHSTKNSRWWCGVGGGWGSESEWERKINPSNFLILFSSLAWIKCWLSSDVVVIPSIRRLNSSSAENLLSQSPDFPLTIQLYLHFAQQPIAAHRRRSFMLMLVVCNRERKNHHHHRASAQYTACAVWPFH